MNNRCNFCGADAGDKLACPSCIDHIRVEEHPFICLGCRELFGPKASLDWINRNEFYLHFQKELNESANKGLTPFFTRQDCHTCLEFKTDEAKATCKPLFSVRRSDHSA